MSRKQNRLVVIFSINQTYIFINHTVIYKNNSETYINHSVVYRFIQDIRMFIT